MVRHTGSAIRVDFENTYEYQNKTYNDFNDIADILNFNLRTAEDIRSYDKDVESTLKYAVEIAKDFVYSTHPSNPGGKYQTTNNLARSIKFDRQTSSGGNGGRLYADAKDPRGRPYAGHIEYGYTDRGGNPRGPWPFLRPAMRLAISATRYDFAKTMEDLISGKFNQGQMSIGAKNARQSVRNVYGSTSKAMSVIKNTYQDDFSRTIREDEWNLADSGIGFKSGVSTEFRASDWSWGEGAL